MRIILSSLVILSLSCSNDKLVKSSDFQCYTECFSGKMENKGIGQCKAGYWGCDENGEITECVGQVLPSQEVCDGVDNDCDGTIDLITSDCSTACGSGRQVCRNGEWQGCTAPQPKPEVCNGVDDNCDGQIDESENLPITPCYGSSDLNNPELRFGECSPGIMRCKNGQNVCLGDKHPQPEVCDNLDNDCNGKIDDDPSCGGPAVNLKVVLTWSWPDNDLDLHLRNPAASGSSNVFGGWTNLVFPYDCYYANKNPLWDSVNLYDDPHLDVDDTIGVGPENITMDKMDSSNLYTVGVHAFALRNSYPTATVKIYCGSILKATRTHQFMVNKDMWVVGTVQYSATNNCTFTPDDTIFKL